ncbi:MAG: M20/M25/M40 family metallo-hydrolase [Lachnospiraceae bacterium]|nr:M20/M25/M40 family metallo-hydrolase [Lachnospiraceae bacterium]
MVWYEDVKKTFADLVSIDSPSLHEEQAAERIKELFAEIGITLCEDDSAEQTGSTTGNLYAYVKGDGRKAPVLLAAHMDTVMPAYGKKAVFEADGTVRSDGTTVVGADVMAWIAEIYHALKYLKENQIAHRDTEILFTVGEELYCKGAKAFDYGRIKSKSAYVLDLSGRIGDAAYAAPTILSFCATVSGKAAHAGFCPEAGRNAIAAAAKAVAQLPQGRIDDVTTANIGMISGGSGVNIVSEQCTVQGEIRSLHHEKAVALAKRYREQFAKAAQDFGASAAWEETVDIRAYETSLDSDVVREFEKAAVGVGVEAKLLKSFGGSDNNVFFQHGIEGLVVACSMNNVHSCKEYANVHEIVTVTEILVRLLAENEDILQDFSR